MKPIAMLRCWIGILLVCGAIGLSGCRSPGTPPTGVLSKAELAVNQASETRAPQYAPLELRMARDKLERAKQAMDAGQYQEARRWAEQALVDAQLAEAKAEAETQRQTVQQLRKSIEALRGEAERALQ